MPPKSVPKLTKKQIQQQKKEQARLQKQKQEEQAAIEQAKRQQQQRLRAIQRAKTLEQQRVRIAGEKQKYYPILEKRLQSQNQAYAKLLKQQKWNKFTTPYDKDYSVQGTNLSTFINLFTNYKHKNPKLTVAECQQCQKYISKLQQKILSCRADYNTKGQKQCMRSIQLLQKQQLNKLEQIMIQYANSAEQMQQKNAQESKRKNQSNPIQKQAKIVYNIYQLSNNFKIGMYINTISTKVISKYDPIQIKQFGFKTQIPSKLSNSTTITKFQWFNFDPFSSPNNKEEFRIVGRVFNLEFYDMFVGTKKLQNITIKKYYKGKEILDKFKLPLKESLVVTYQIPKYIFMAPYSKITIQLAQFDTAVNKWVLVPNENIIDYLQQQKRIKCKISKPQPLAFIANRCSDYPYHAWELRTVEKGKVLLDFQLARTIPNKNGEFQQFMIQFQIGPNVMKLQTDTQWPQFKDLTQNYYTPEQILWELSRRGVHLLPTDNDYQYAGVKHKDREAQKNAIRDIAYAVESFSIRSQPNDTSDIRVKMRENLDYENIFLEDQEKDWKRIRWGDKDKCWVDGKGIMQRHCNLEKLLQNHDFCHKQCLDRIKYNSDYLLRKTVMKVLQLTRIFAFTTANLQIKSKLVEILKQKIIVA